MTEGILKKARVVFEKIARAGHNYEKLLNSSGVVRTFGG
jgi:hypothetical protein